MRSAHINSYLSYKLTINIYLLQMADSKWNIVVDVCQCPVDYLYHELRKCPVDYLYHELRKQGLGDDEQGLCAAKEGL